MAKQDFCFTYYDGDAARDMAHMNRLQRGAYNDIIISQRKFGALTPEHIKMILSRDFDECWPAIELVLTKEGDKYHIAWLTISIEKMKAHSNRQKINAGERKVVKAKKEKSVLEEPELLSGRTKQHKWKNQNTSLEEPLEDENGNEDGNENKSKDETETENDVELWTRQVISNEDTVFTTLFNSQHLKKHITITDDLIQGHETKCLRENTVFETQNHFRKSLIQYLKSATNGTTAHSTNPKANTARTTATANYSSRL